MTEIQIILPKQDDDPLVDMLLEITKTIAEKDETRVAHGFLGGEFGYGGHWDDDIFLMHPECWCDKEGECPWCTGCAVYTKQCRICSDPTSTAEGRRAASPEMGCDYVAGRGIFARFAPWTLSHEIRYYDPPNFWHKPTNMRVRWYKYIGREMAALNVPRDLSQILSDCLRAITK